MALDEFETLRLIDLEGLTQEQCAAQMQVARTTVQAIYSAARQKLADCLVNRKELVLRGGDYVLCGGSPEDRCTCGNASCRCNEPTKLMEDDWMKIAVTYENGEIFQHFGHTEQFKIYEIENGAVVDSQVVSTNGSGHGALADFLLSQGVDAVICGGIGGGAQQALANARIHLFGGVYGEADRAVEALLTGQLAYDPDVHCDHHEHHGHEEGHNCGGCGHHGCGG